MRSSAVMMVGVILCSSLTGCFASESSVDITEDSIFSFPEGKIPITTWYHFAGSVEYPWAVDATDPAEVNNANLSINLSGLNIPYYTSGTYYGTGWDTFEPTIGITSSGAIFFTNYNGLGDGTHIIRSRDQGQI